MANEWLELPLGVSRIQQWLYCAVHGLALLALGFTGLSWPWLVLLAAVQCRLGWLYWQRHILRTGTFAVRAIRFYQGRWRVNRGGQWLLAWPQGQAFVSRFLMCFTLRLNSIDSRQSVAVVVFPDSAKPRQIHALRLRLLLDGFASRRCEAKVKAWRRGADL